MAYKDKEKARENKLRYRASHREEIAEYVRRYRGANRGKFSELSRRYYAGHREEVLERKRRYRAANPEKDRRYKASDSGQAGRAMEYIKRESPVKLSSVPPRLIKIYTRFQNLNRLAKNLK
jgi:hypothetical protein